MFKNLLLKWKDYRYRFTPWMPMTLKERTIRRVTPRNDALISRKEVIQQLIHAFQCIEETDEGLKNEFLVDSMNWELRYPFTAEIHEKLKVRQLANLDRMERNLGFKVERGPSSIGEGQRGVLVTGGRVQRNQVVAMYPGLVYELADPIFFPSIGNKFIFQCLDGTIIDGNDRGLSRFLFKQCYDRDVLAWDVVRDQTWLTPYPFNPLAVGQYVNNASFYHPANVVYQEVDLPHDFPYYLLKYIPYSFYGMDLKPWPDFNRYLRMVVLVSMRCIPAGEEIRSNYITAIEP